MTTINKRKVFLILLLVVALFTMFHLLSWPSSYSPRALGKQVVERTLRAGFLSAPSSQAAWASSDAPPTIAPQPHEGNRQEIFDARRALVKEVCSRNMSRVSYGSAAQVPMSMFRFYKKRDMVVCFSAKAGSSTWLRYLFQDAFPGRAVNKRGVHARGQKFFKAENNASKTARLQQLMNATRIVNVRHPFTRVLSAYKNKFEPCLTSSNCNGKHLLKSWRSIVSFKAFVDYLLDHIPVEERVSAKRYRKFDRHWRPFFLNCGVCDIDFHYVVKMETYDDDLRYILSKLGFHEEVSLHFNNSNSTAVELDYYRTLPRETILRLYELYRPDFELFGYSIDKFLN